MKNLIPQYTFYKTKYGSELLIDVVELRYVKKFLRENPAHTLTYYDITFITEGEGSFSIDNKDYVAAPRDVIFSQPGEMRNWDIENIANGYALIFEDKFLSAVFKDPLFVQHLSYFSFGKPSSRLPLSGELYTRMIQLLTDIKTEIDAYKQNGVHVLRALLYEILMLLDRTYRKMIPAGSVNKEGSNVHIRKFIELVNDCFREQHSVRYYADKLCITPNYLNEITNSVMHVTAKQYIQDKVIEESKRLLAYTHIPISEIAYTLHFSTTSYFVRFFRQSTGMTPLSYRNKIES